MYGALTDESLGLYAYIRCRGAGKMARGIMLMPVSLCRTAQGEKPQDGGWRNTRTVH